MSRMYTLVATAKRPVQYGKINVKNIDEARYYADVMALGYISPVQIYNGWPNGKANLIGTVLRGGGYYLPKNGKIAKPIDKVTGKIKRTAKNKNKPMEYTIRF